MEIDRIGSFVRFERQRRGLTQGTLAEMADVSKGRIEAIENGRCLNMGINTVNNVLLALGYSLSVAPVPA